MGVLGYTGLRVGQKVLGVIKIVNDFDMVISLPNQLTGFVSCDHISACLSSRFAAFSAPGDSALPMEIPSLSQFYSVGETVVACISGLGTPDNKRRIELSLRAETVNAGLGVEGVITGVILAGEIQSQEDRGWTVALGMASSEPIVGFLPSSEVEGATTKMLPGKTMPLLVASSFKNKVSRVVTLTASVNNIASATLGSGNVDFCSLRCGTKVEAVVKDIKKGNIVVSVAGHNAFMDLMNLPDRVMLKRHKDLDLAEHFPVGKKISARIAIVEAEEKHLWLTSKSMLLSWSPSVEAPRVGEHIENARVVRIDPNMGLLLSFSSSPSSPSSPSTDEGMREPETCYAYAHISRLADERVESIDGPFKVGSKHAARLIDFDAFSGMYLASLKASDLNAAILRIQDLHPGQTVRGTVLKCESFGVLVALTDRIRALCPTAHLTELQSPAALKAYSVGQKYKFRVLDADPHTRRITLTRKKGLLDTTLPILSEYSQAQPGNMHDGYIVAIREFGCLVKFFGEVKGIVPVAEISDEFVDHPQDSCFLGQVVRCRIVKCSPESRELRLSLRKQSGPKALPEGVKRIKSTHPSNDSNDKKKTLDDLVAAS